MSILGWVTVRGYNILVFNQATQAYSAWPSLRGYWVGAMSRLLHGDGLGDRWGRNGEFCVTVGPVTRSPGLLAYWRSQYGAGRYGADVGRMLA